MDNRKPVKKTGDKKEDSAMSTVIPCESFYSSNETTALNNSQELSSQVVRSTSSLPELLLLDSNESTSTGNDSQAEAAISEPRERFYSCCSSSCNTASPMRIAPEFPKQLVPFNPLSMKKTGACQPNEPLKVRNVFVNPMAPKQKRKKHERIPLRAMVQATSKLNKARKLPKVKSEINSDPLIEASASTHQPIVTDSTSVNDDVNLPYSSYDSLNSVKSRNNRKSAKKTGDKTEDSTMSIVFLNASVPSLRNSQELRTQVVESNSLLRDSNESSSKNNSPAELRENPLIEFLLQLHSSFTSYGPSSRDETSTRNVPEFSKQRVPSSPLSMERTEACQPHGPLKPRETFIIQMVPKRKTRDHRKKSVRGMKHMISISDEARNLPGVHNGMSTNASEAKASTSTHHQRLVQDGTSTNDQPTSSHNASHSVKSRERVSGQIEPRADPFPIYVSEAQTLLQSVLKEIMLYNKQKDQWRRFMLQFLNKCESESSSEKDLMNYLSQLNKDLPWEHGPNMSRLVTIETYVEGVCEMLTSKVVSTLIFIETVQSSRDFDGFILTHLFLKGLYDSFSHFWESNNIEAIENEAFRNRVKFSKRKIQRLLLLTLSACRLFLMYVGENAEEESLRKYEEHLSDEDKMYLGRNV